MIWEWEWECVIPSYAGREGGGECVYEGGERVELPARGEGRFVGGGGEGGEYFKVGVPLLFVVNVRVLEVRGGVVTEGRWEELFNVVEGEGETMAELEIEESRWMCDDGTVGYMVSFFL